MQRRFGVAVGAVAIGFAGVFGLGPSAAAETANTSAGGGLYVYEHDNFKGGSAFFRTSDPNLSNNSWRGTPGRIINNNISSMKNTSNHDVVMYDIAASRPGSCHGRAYLAKAHSEDKDLTNNGFDNRASCIKFG
jgi:Peptidase inhibitor family I36